MKTIVAENVNLSHAPPKKFPEARSRALLAVFGLLAGLILVEASLRLAGMAAALPQNFSNRWDGGDPADYRILTLGESTTFGSRNWPYFLEKFLNEGSGGRRYKVFNAAIPGASTADLLAGLEGNLDTLEPHVVISMMGINDADSRVIWEGPAPTKGLSFWKGMKTYKLLLRLRDSFSRWKKRAFGDPSNPDRWIDVAGGALRGVDEAGVREALARARALPLSRPQKANVEALSKRLEHQRRRKSVGGF